MAHYCEEGDLRARLSEEGLFNLVDDDQDDLISGTEARAIERSLQWADDQINDACYGRYSVPFDTTQGSGADNTVIRSHAMDLAAGYLSLRMGWGNAKLEAMMQASMDWLDGVTAGHRYIYNETPATDPHALAVNQLSAPFSKGAQVTQVVGKRKVERIDDET